MAKKVKKRGIDKIRYDRVAKLYDQFESPMEFFAYKKWRKKLFKRMKPQKGELILEFGVGTGKNILFYGEGKYISFDVSRKMILKAKERARGKAFILEHMLPKSRMIQPFFHIINPFVRIFGPEINRKTDKNIKEAGFEIVEEEKLLFTVFRIIEAKKV